MSANMSWQKKHHSYTEDAIELIRECVSVLRGSGLKTDAALQDMPALFETTPRRIRSLFHREDERIVLKNEWMSLRYRGGLFFLNNAARLRELADKHEEIGNNLVSGQLELEWETSTNVSLKRCA